MGSSVSSTQGSVVALATAVVALLAVSQALPWGVGIATLVALWEGSESILVDEDTGDITVEREVRSAWPFSLAFWYCLYLDLSSWQ